MLGCLLVIMSTKFGAPIGTVVFVLSHGMIHMYIHNEKYSQSANLCQSRPFRIHLIQWYYIVLSCILASYSLSQCDLNPLTFDLYRSLKLSEIRHNHVLEIFRELNKLLYATILNRVISKKILNF